MAKWRVVSNTELMKLLSDPRRNRILHLTSERPMTVKQLAEQLGEHPSRLYYHVNKLVEFDLLEVAETRQHGNLVEKVYRSVKDVFYRTDLDLLADSPHLAMARIHQAIDPGIRLFEKALEELRQAKARGKKLERLPYHVTIDSGSGFLTAREWLKALLAVHKAMGDVEVEEEEWFENLRAKLTPEEEQEKGTYQYVLISYRIEDAEKLGLFPSEEEEGQAGKNECSSDREE